MHDRTKLLNVSIADFRQDLIFFSYVLSADRKLHRLYIISVKQIKID